MSRHNIWLSLTAVALVATACATTAEADFESNDEPTSVVVTAGIGNVTIRANPASGTEVRWNESGSTPTATIEGGVLTVSDDCTADCRVDYTLLVGDNADVTVDLADGNVSISNVDGNMDVAVTTGDVNLNTIAGSFTVAVDDEGDILGARLEGSVASFRTASGSIDVTFDSAVSDLVVESGRGDVTAQVAGGPYAVEATASGAIDVLVDTDAAASPTITITTADGDATVYKK